MSKYTVDTVEDATRHLYDLLEVMCHTKYELTAAGGDTRFDSLLWLARDLTDGIMEKIKVENQAAIERFRKGRLA